MGGLGWQGRSARRTGARRSRSRQFQKEGAHLRGRLLRTDTTPDDCHHGRSSYRVRLRSNRAWRIRRELSQLGCAVWADRRRFMLRIRCAPGIGGPAGVAVAAATPRAATDQCRHRSCLVHRARIAHQEMAFKARSLRVHGRAPVAGGRGPRLRQRPQLRRGRRRPLHSRPRRNKSTSSAIGLKAILYSPRTRYDSLRLP